MAFQYKYKAFAISTRLTGALRRSSKSVTIVSVLIVLILSFYLITSNVTAYVTYTENIEKKLNETAKELVITKASMEECSKNLASTRDNLNSCTADLDQSKSQLTTCNSERSALQTRKSELESQLSNCTAEKEDFRTRYENGLAAFNSIVKNSVRAICCSFGDVVSGTTKNWGIVDNKIVCTGSYNVNCSSGETDF
jgi:septal ring factor EnvC (AmiA/AmiB activator)